MKKANKGFTLVEVVLVMGLISVVIAVSYSIFFTGQKSFEVGIDKGIDQQESRIIREYLIKEFRYIAYLGTEKPDADKYYTLKIKETTQGSESRQLEKVQYKDSEEINREILPIKFNDLSMKIENGTMNVKLNTAGNNSDYNFTILMENDPTLSSQKFSMASDKIYYAYPEDILIADDESIEEPNEDEIGGEADSDDHHTIEEWDENKDYKDGDIVIYNGKKYRSSKNNKGKNPTKHLSHWQLIK